MQLLTPAIRERIRQIVLGAIKRLPPHITPSDPRFLEWLESLIRYHAGHPMDPAAGKAPVLGGIGVADKATPWNLLDELEELICGFLSIPVTTDHPAGWGKPFTPENVPLGTPGGTEPDVFLTFGDTDFPAGRLDRSTGYEAGNVDWVDENGGIYTWGGPRSRYFVYSGRIDNSTPWDPTPSDSPLEIYYEGALFDTAPVEILGFGRYTYTTDEDEAWATLLIVQAEDVSDLHGVVLHVRAKQYEIAAGPASGSWVDIDTYDTRLGVYPDWKFAAFRWPNSIAPFKADATESTIVLRDCSYITMTFSDLDSIPSVAFNETQRDYAGTDRPGVTQTTRECLFIDIADSACNPDNTDSIHVSHRTKMVIKTPGTCSVDLTSSLPTGGFSGTSNELFALAEQIAAAACADALMEFPICVDYDLDDERVFAYRYDTAYTESGYVVLYDYRRTHTVWTCPLTWVSSAAEWEIEEGGKSTSLDGTVVILPWLDDPICLTGSISVNGEGRQIETGGTSSGCPGMTGIKEAVSPLSHSITSGGKGNIRYLDLRHQLVVLGQQSVTDNKTEYERHQDFAAAGDWVSDSAIFDYSNRITIVHKDAIVYSGDYYADRSTGFDIPLSQLTCPADSVSPEGGGADVDWCNNSSSEIGTDSPASDDFKDYLFWHKVVAGGVEEIEIRMDQWYAACLAGDVAISQQLFGPLADPLLPWVRIDESFHYLYRAARGEQPEAEYDYLEKLEMPDETWPKSTEIKILSITLE